VEQQDFDLLEEGVYDLQWTTTRRVDALQDQIDELTKQLAEQSLVINTCYKAIYSLGVLPMYPPLSDKMRVIVESPYVYI